MIYLDPPFSSNSNYNLPFKSQARNVKAVEAFIDTWTWDERSEETLSKFHMASATKGIANIIEFARQVEGQKKFRLDAYLVNMAERLFAMKRVLKETGSLYLHCDPTASHYLKLLLDAIFGRENFRNEIVWCYTGNSDPRSQYPNKHDIIFFYAKSDRTEITKQWLPYSESTLKRYNHVDEQGRRYKNSTLNPTSGMEKIYAKEQGRRILDWWDDFPIVRGKERLGYPTQKPVSLLSRIIQTSSSPGDLVLDPFCGCGTTLHAAHDLGRRWIGIDVSRFSTELVKNRILANFRNGEGRLTTRDITIVGVPETPGNARELARRDKWEFEKWVCGHIGAVGMFRDPGRKGPDGGVDGVLKFYPVEKPFKEQIAIVQVKGGNVTPDSVKALSVTVEKFNAKAGVMICFEDQMRTVNNQRSRKTFTDATNHKYPVIQGISIEEMLNEGKKPYLPNMVKMADKNQRIDSRQMSLLN